MRRAIKCIVWIWMALAAAAVAMAAPETANGPNADAAKAPAVEVEPVAPAVTEHRITVAGVEIAYRATAGEIVLKDREQKPIARIFYVAYTRLGQEPETRPLTFSFNGGPGSSSIWMHMGLLGPKRVRMDADGFALPPPHELVDNAYTLLDTTDLVFIDPVSTGYSRPVDFEKEKSFHGLEEDVEAVGEFIRRYTTEEARWASPKFLIGESYGTTRAAALALHLQERHGMYLNGIMLVSSVLDFSTLQFAEGNDMPYVLFLPSLAATAHYHKRLPEPLQALPVEELLAEVEAFASGRYRAALFAGDALDPAERVAVAQQLTSYLGLPVELIQRAQLRVSAFEFFGDLLADSGERVGRFDGRYRGVASQQWERYRTGAGPDPSYTQLYGAYASAFNDYIRRQLKFETILPYNVLTSVWPWNYGENFQTRYVNIVDRLREAIIMNPHLQVHVCSGYYDLATPYFATDYTLQRLYLHPNLKDNIHVRYYHSGHMMYSVESELAKQKHNLATFIKAAGG